MDEQKDAKYQTYLSGPTQGFVQGEHNTVILVSKEPGRADSTQRQTPSPQPLWIRLCCWLAKQRSFVWGTIIFGIFLNLLATWLVTPWGSILANTPLETLLNHSGIGFGIGIGLLALTGMVTIVSRNADAYELQMRSLQKPTQQDQSACVQALHQEYRKQLEHSLQGAAMIAVELHERRDVICSSTQLAFRRLSTAVEHPLPSGTSIIEVYDDAKRGLLILGEPGAGKTTLLLELASELLRRAEGETVHPIPVILNLSSWTSKRLPLQCWLIDQLRLVYGIPSRFSQAWLEQDQWLLLLDGLDEVEESSRQACVEAINTYRGEHFVPLVVCSRSTEYLSQNARLAFPRAVVVQPLEEAQVTEYLKWLGKSMAAVRKVVRSNPTLRQLITTPLWLHVIIFAYRDKTIRDLPQLGSPEEQQRQIFDRYVQRTLELQTTRGRFTSQQTRRWLIWLAQQMKQRNLTEFYLEELQPSWLTTKRAQGTYQVFSGLVGGLGVGLVGGLILGLVGGLILGLVGGLVRGLILGLIGLEVGLVFGLVGGLVLGLIFGLVRELVRWLTFGLRKIHEIHPVEVLTWSWKNFWQEGLKFGLGAGLVLWLMEGLVGGLIGGLIVGLGVGLAAGGLSGTQASKGMRTRPNQGIRNSGWNALRGGLVFGLVGELILGLMGGRVEGLVGGLVFGLVGGLECGLVGGLVFGGEAYFCHYILRYFLSQSGVMPWHSVRFLEEATERILLQRVGGGYRFAHPLLLDYFASLEPEASSSSIPQSE